MGKGYANYAMQTKGKVGLQSKEEVVRVCQRRLDRQWAKLWRWRKKKVISPQKKGGRVVQTRKEVKEQCLKLTFNWFAN